MPGREAAAVGVVAEMGQAQRPRIGEDDTENPAPGGRWAHGPLLARTEPEGDEVGDGPVLGVEHADGGEAGPGQGAGLSDHVFQEGGQLQIGLQEERCRQDPSELDRVLDRLERHRWRA